MPDTLNSPMTPLQPAKTPSLPGNKGAEFNDSNAADNQYQKGIDTSGGGIDQKSSPMTPLKK